MYKNSAPDLVGRMTFVLRTSLTLGHNFVSFEAAILSVPALY